ncbi:MAG: hypothetical protein JW702_11200 [Clostridiales bacterium]|nr:hypothetical protein [Clostridiales bacterium]
MKKIIQSALVSTLLVITTISAIMPVCFGLTKNDYDWDPKFPQYPYVNESVSASVTGTYNSGYDFHHVRFISNRGLGQADGFNGYLWFWWTVDSDTIEYYSAGTNADEQGECDASYLVCETQSGFYEMIGGEPYSWYDNALAGPIIS